MDLEQVERCYPTVLIDGDGNFNSQIEQDLKLAGDSRPVAAVSIFGVQSTGKSTLMNLLISTNFPVMDASHGMHQTTKGIWVAKCPLTNCGHDILAIDTEGSDGSEREDDTKYEKQTALFVLAISKIVIINMKCDTVNLHHGGNQSLLQTVFEVMLRLTKTPRKVNMVFVLRDKNKCPSDKLEEQLKKGLHKIWNGMTKPQSQVNVALEDYFNIKVVAMSNYEEKEQQFQEEVADLREWIISKSTSDEAAAGFVEYAKNIWDKIQEAKDLDLPSYKTMVAEVFCNRIALEKYQSFCEDESWLQIKEDVESGAVIQHFGEKVSSLIDKYLSQYGNKAVYYDKTKRDESEKQLTADILKVVKPTYVAVVERMRQAIRENFEKAIVELMKNRVLVAMTTQNFIKELWNQLKDAVIKQANWNQTRYDNKAVYYDKTKRDESEKQLIEVILKAIRENFVKAIVELMKNGDLVAMTAQNFNELGNQLRDAVIKQANWNQTTEQLNKIRSEMDGYIKGVRDMIEILVKEKSDRLELWLKVASILGNVLLAACVGALVSHPAIRHVGRFPKITVATTFLAKLINQETAHLLFQMIQIMRHI